MHYVCGSLSDLLLTPFARILSCSHAPYAATTLTRRMGRTFFCLGT
jgi:hypothetical protein